MASKTFIKLLDTMPEHPKVIGLSDPAFRAFIELLCYCSRYLTDGTIPDTAVRRMAAPKVVSELVAAGLLDRHGDSVEIHDYLEHQTSKQKVSDLRAKRAAAGSKGGAVC